MEHAKPNSYDKAMNSWHDAKIRYGQALPYLKKGAEDVVCIAVWLGGLILLTNALRSSNTASTTNSDPSTASPQAVNIPKSDGITPNLPAETQRLVGLFETINSSKNSTVYSIPLTTVLALYAKDPQNGKKIVDKTWYTIKNCSVGTWDLLKAGYHLTHYYICSEPEISEHDSRALGEDGEEVVV